MKESPTRQESENQNLVNESMEVKENSRGIEDSLPIKHKPISFYLFLLFMVFAVVGLAWVKYFVAHKQQVTYTIETKKSPTPQPESSTVSLEKIDDSLTWQTTHTIGNFTYKSPKGFDPVEQYQPVSAGQGVFIVSNHFNFDDKKLPLCEKDDQQTCLLSKQNGWQSDAIVATQLGGIKANSFFVMTPNKDKSGTIVLHVIQTQEEPFIEVASAVDGAGLEETFQLILATFKLDSLMSSSIDSSAIEKAATIAYSKKNGQPPEGSELKVSELQVKGDFAMGNIIVTATEEGGPSLSKFMAHKQDGKWQVALEYTTTYLDWFKTDGSQFFDDQDTYVYFRDEHYGIK